MELWVPTASFAVDDDDWLFAFCRMNDELRIERTSDGDLEIEMPTGGETSDRNSEINMQLRLWAKLGRQSLLEQLLLQFGEVRCRIATEA